MKDSFEVNLDDEKRLIRIGKAISVPTRIDILKLLCEYELNVNEIAEKLSLPTSSAAAHVKVLEESGLIETRLLPAVRGSMKVCRKVVEKGEIHFSTSDSVDEKYKVISMPVGHYTDYKVEPTCGLAGSRNFIGIEDEPKSFYLPERIHTGLLWLGKGYVEYRFPNNSLDSTERRVEISMEMCSEINEYDMDYPSDITLWINGIDAGTWRCPSDFGGRRGKLNPAWWPNKNTQYGVLKTWKISKEGTFIDDQKISEVTLKDYKLGNKDYITVRIGIKEDAEYQGGVNLFGETYGDYAQNINMKIYF